MLSCGRERKKTIWFNLSGSTGQDLRDHNRRPHDMVKGARTLDFNPGSSTPCCVTLGKPPDLSGSVSLFIKQDKAPFLVALPGG